MLPDGHMELPGHVDKEQSHQVCPYNQFHHYILCACDICTRWHFSLLFSIQNVLVVKTPRVPEEVRSYQGSNICFKAEVRVSSGRAGTCSAPLPFYYIPNGKNMYIHV